MNKVFSIVAAGVIMAGAAMAQPDSLWSRTYGGVGANDGCNSLIQTTDGGFAMAGYTQSLSEEEEIPDFWLVRTNADGDSLWSRSFGGGDDDYCYSLIQTVDGGFALAGYTWSFGAGEVDFWLVRTDADGDSLWSRTFGGDYMELGFSIIPTTEGGYALAGYSDSFGAGSWDFWLVMTDADGDSLWSCSFGGEGDEYCTSIIQTADGGFALAGYTESFGAGNSDIWLVRTDANGDSLWSRTFGGEYSERCFTHIQTTDGGFAVAGYTESFGAGNSEFWLVRMDADGETLWSHTYGGRGYEGCNSLIQTADGGFALAGYTESFGAGALDFWLIKTNADGDSLWSQTFGGQLFDQCSSHIQTADGGFALAGSTASFGAGEEDFWLVKTGKDTVLSAPRSELTLNPSSLILGEPYPNPFNSRTVASYQLPVSSFIRMGLFDMQGREVAILQDGAMQAGEHRLVVNAEGLATGSYLIRLEAGGAEASRTVTLIK